MTARGMLGVALFAAVLALGLWTAWVAAANHEKARELDRRMRACDALEVWNESLRHEVLFAEEALLERRAEVLEEGEA